MDYVTYDRCRICINEECGGKHDCHCSTCENIDKCPKLLSATVRITNKCTQKCSHCCFKSHPDSKIMMSVAVAENIAKFVKNNNVFRLNVMGGEFFCNPDWYEILDLLIDSSYHTRLVSNSDWAKNEKVKSGLLKLAEKYNEKLYISLSYDKWHTNKNVDLADKFLTENNIHHNVANENDLTEHGIVPVGRAIYEYSYYSSIGTYCHVPDNEYSMLIDEDGDIYKCVFGTWNYANINDYISGGFEERFKEYHKKCRKVFIPNCARCRSCADMLNKSKDANFEKIVVETC